MTREEEADKASKSYASQMCVFCLDEYCKEKGLTCPQFRESIIAFSEGVKWVNNHSKNIWHPASEKPQGTYWRIICQNDEGECWIQEWSDVIQFYYTWNDYVKVKRLVKWAYIDELIKE